jgi:hypothetical protein
MAFSAFRWKVIQAIHPFDFAPPSLQPSRLLGAERSPLAAHADSLGTRYCAKCLGVRCLGGEGKKLFLSPRNNCLARQFSS